MPHKFTQYLLSSDVGFRKCEVLSIPSHPSRGFQRPIQLFTKAESVPEEGEIATRGNRRDQQNQKDIELKEYERDLFRKAVHKEGNMSEISQQSNESMSQYEQFENVYAPSATPCYDTPGHSNDNQQSLDASKMCYLDISIEHNKTSTDIRDNKKTSDEEIDKQSQSATKCSDDVKTSQINNVSKATADIVLEIEPEAMCLDHTPNCE